MRVSYSVAVSVPLTNTCSPDRGTASQNCQPNRSANRRSILPVTCSEPYFWRIRSSLVQPLPGRLGRLLRVWLALGSVADLRFLIARRGLIGGPFNALEG